MKFFYKSIAIVLIALLLFPSDALARKYRRQKATRFSGTAAILMEANSHKRYFGQNIERRVFPASTTKVLTAIVVMENLSLDDVVKVGVRATQVQPTKLDLREGERYTVRDLLYGLMLKSANDAAIVLAEAVAGSQAKFVEMMNKKAYQIGARNSRFANAHGLPSDGIQYTTAYDMALILRYAMTIDFLAQSMTYKYRFINSKDGRRIVLKSHNKSLFLGWKQNVYGKTGYTREAQSCFVGSIPRGKENLIIAVFGCNRRWDDIKFILERYGKIDL
jgi:D-alanyl-D-alanine carboxypeptidase (penicillin-binding protein 5/6)